MIRLPPTGMSRISSWDTAFEEAKDNPQLITALRAFREWLSPGWRNWQVGAPLACQFFTAFQGNPPEGLRLHRLVGALNGVPHLHLHVRKSLGVGPGTTAWPQYWAGVMSVEFAEAHVTAGRKFEFLQNTDKRTPDAVLHLVDRPVTVEFKGLHPSDDMESWLEFNQKIVDLLAPHRLGINEFDTDFANAALAHPEEVVEGLVAVHRSGSSEWTSLPLQTGRARLSNGHEGLPGLPVCDRNDAERISLKLGNWSTQLRDCSGPAILVVRASHLFWFLSEEEISSSADLLWRAVAKGVEKHASISALLVYERPLAPPVPSFFQDHGAFRVAAGERYGCPFGGVLIPNPLARSVLTGAELDLLLASRTTY